MTKEMACAVLHVPSDANDDVIKKNYLKIAKIFHPDKNNNTEESNEVFQNITEAYDYLINHKYENEEAVSESQTSSSTSNFKYSKFDSDYYKQESDYQSVKTGSIFDDGFDEGEGYNIKIEPINDTYLNHGLTEKEKSEKLWAIAGILGLISTFAEIGLIACH